MITATNKKTGQISTLDAKINGHKIEALAFKGFNNDLELLLKSQIEFNKYLESPEFTSSLNEDDDYGC